MTTYPVLAHPDGAHYREITRIVETVNALQSYFRCMLLDGSDLLSPKVTKVDSQRLAARIRKAYPGQRVLSITESYYRSSLVLEELLPDQILVTAADWDEEDAPSLPTFLLHSFASSLITFEAGLSKRANQRMGHAKSVGCLFDWWSSSEQLAVILVCARMCPRCEQQLRQQFDVTPAAIQATNSLLDHVRRKVLGQHPQVPNKVFVAHGWSQDWRDLKTMLEEFGVDVAEFNETTPIGRTIPDRWREMLEQSRFAFALLTPDEELAPGVRHPRPNVIHEIGLCQGRLGLERAVVLREKSVPLFSNLAGVIDIPFESGKLSQQRASIRSLLERHGLVSAGST